MLYYNEQEFHNGNKTRERTFIENEEPGFQHVMIEPQIPLEFWEFLHDISLFLIVDDKHDLGHFTYYNRNDHYYRFKKSPHHPSPFHHWQIGIVGLVTAQLGGLLSKALEIKNSITPKQKIPDKFIVDSEVINITPPKKALPSNNDVYTKLTSALDTL